MSKRLGHQEDVQRILRDVLDSHGFHHVSTTRVDRTPTGWHIVMTDASDSFLSTDVPDGSPAQIQAADAVDPQTLTPETNADVLLV